MKTESEIRKHRDNLRRSLGEPCDCAAKGHERGCEIGRVMALALADALSWALGEPNDHGPVVEQFARTSRPT